MLKFLGVTAATTILPKLFHKIGDSLSDTYDSVFNKKKEEVVQTTVRKKHDNTKFTRQMAMTIRHHHFVNDSGTGAEHTEELNKILGLNKSRSA